MVRLELSKGANTLIYEADFKKISQWRWKLGTHGYAVRTTRQGAILLHRLITKAKPGQVVDHINGDKLDNRRSNLRLCTQSQNMMAMRTKKSGMTSVYKGVSRTNNKWRAYIVKDYRQKNLGYFKTELEAAKAYDRAAKELFGDFATTNL